MDRDGHLEPEERPAPTWSLSSVVTVFWRRKYWFVAGFVPTVLVTLVVAMQTTPVYESEASIIPLDHWEVTVNWLSSRRAAEIAATELDAASNAQLFAQDWSGASWVGDPPSIAERAVKIHEIVTIDATRAREGGLIQIDVRHPNAAIAQDVASAYLAALGTLESDLRNITRVETLNDYFGRMDSDGPTTEEARRSADEYAAAKQFWLIVDEPMTPQRAIQTAPIMAAALALTMGILVGTFLAFGAEALGRQRTR